MATQQQKQNVIKAKNETNQRAAIASRFGNDVAEVLDEEVNEDWRDIQNFTQNINFDD